MYTNIGYDKVMHLQSTQINIKWDWAMIIAVKIKMNYVIGIFMMGIIKIYVFSFFMFGIEFLFKFKSY